jgi:hypothetical protein
MMDSGISVLIRYLPRPVDRALRRWCYPAVLTAKNHRVRLTRLVGQSRSGQVTMLVAGPEPWAYDLPLRVFQTPPKRIDAGTVPVWQLNSAITRMAPDVDLVMARVDSLTARLFCGSHYLRVPEWIETGRSVPEDLRKLVRSTHSLSEDLRLSRHYKLEAEVTHSEEDFHDFYHTMYVPFIRARHGAMAWPSNEESLRHSLHRGGIIWLRCAGERIAALLFDCTTDSLHMGADGVLHGDLSILKKGVISALFYNAFRQAAERNCRFVDFGGCRACLSDGILRYKRKWGISVRVRPGNQFYTLINWATWTPAVAAFLRDVPVLHQAGNQLVGVTAASAVEPGTQEDVDKIHQTVSIPGIDRLVVVSEAGWSAGIVPPPSTVLVGGRPPVAQLVAV